MSDNITMLKSITTAIINNQSKIPNARKGFEPPSHVDPSSLASNHRRVILDPLVTEAETSRFASAEHQAYVLEREKYAVQGLAPKEGKVIEVAALAGDGQGEGGRLGVEGLTDGSGSDRLGKIIVRRGNTFVVEVSLLVVLFLWEVIDAEGVVGIP
jgi:hypothetical protein